MSEDWPFDDLNEPRDDWPVEAIAEVIKRAEERHAEYSPVIESPWTELDYVECLERAEHKIKLVKEDPSYSQEEKMDRLGDALNYIAFAIAIAERE